MGDGRRRGGARARPAAVLVVVLVLAAGTGAARPARAAAPDGLRQQVVAALAGSRAPLVGAAVALDGLGPAVDLNGWRPLPPASLQKLYTAAAALLLLGPEHRLRTEVRAGGTGLVLPDGTLLGDLVLVAGGDPGLTGDDLQRLAFAVAGAGVRRVTGALVGDDTRYDRSRAPAGWKATFLTDESGPLSALAVDGNRWRRDGAYLADPVAPNLGRFRVALERAGVAVEGPDVVGPAPAGLGSVLAVHESPPLAARIGPLLKDSDNFTAELLLKELGTTLGAASSDGGTEAVWRQAEAFGLPRGQAADGSGLSAHDRAAPWHVVSWLVAVDRTPVAGLLRDSLPLACGDGTLKHRMCATVAAGRVFAKTGTLKGIGTLAGTVTTAGGRRAWFAFMVVGAPSAATARSALDRAAVAVAAYTG